jgi:hypothetical protein
LPQLFMHVPLRDADNLSLTLLGKSPDHFRPVKT